VFLSTPVLAVCSPFFAQPLLRLLGSQYRSFTSFTGILLVAGGVVAGATMCGLILSKLYSKPEEFLWKAFSFGLAIAAAYGVIGFLGCGIAVLASH